MRPIFLLPLAVLGFAASTAAMAQAASPDPTITAATRTAVVDALGRQLKTRYVFPDIATRVAASLASKNAHGDYNIDTTTSAFGEALTRDLHELGKDLHLRVRFEPDFRPEPEQEGKPMSSRKLAEARLEMAHMAYGISRVQRLPGNVGYLDIRGFGPTELVSGAYTSAMSLLSGTDALIIDLRQNGGGEPSSVAYLLSHFFAEGDARHLNDLYSRTDNTTRAYWTDPAVGARYTRPIYVLTSHDTFSGGEECAYDLQTQKRATLVGESTGGGANPGDYIALADGFIAFIPTGRAINPITRTNWEHVGVKPDVTVPATIAMKTAYTTILDDLIHKATDPEEREGLKGTLARLEKGEIELPGYVPRH